MKKKKCAKCVRRRNVLSLAHLVQPVEALLALAVTNDLVLVQVSQQRGHGRAVVVGLVQSRLRHPTRRTEIGRRGKMRQDNNWRKRAESIRSYCLKGVLPVWLTFCLRAGHGRQAGLRFLSPFLSSSSSSLLCGVYNPFPGTLHNGRNFSRYTGIPSSHRHHQEHA